MKRSTFMMCALLAGCSSGGGSGGGGIAGGGGAPFVYPTLLQANTVEMGGFSAAHSRTDNTITSTGPISGSNITLVRSGNNFTFLVSGLSAAPGMVEPPFQFTVNLVNPVGFPQQPTALAGTSCGDCWRTGSADGVAITFLDLAASGMQYSTVGLWSRPSAVPGVTAVGGAAAFGVLTRSVDLPKEGSAQYTGQFIGRYADGVAVHTVGATATSLANFGTGVVSFNTTNSHRSGTPDDKLDLTGSMTFLKSGSGARLNSLQGTVGTTLPNMNSGNGDIRAAFFGPTAGTTPFEPKELGGSLAVSNGSNKTMVGGFALKR